MIALLITIAVFLILLTVITISSDKIINNTKKKQFAREIYEVQNLVDKYKYEKEEYPYTILDDNNEKSYVLKSHFIEIKKERSQKISLLINMFD